jgi:hypothetical protein
MVQHLYSDEVSYIAGKRGSVLGRRLLFGKGEIQTWRGNVLGMLKCRLSDVRESEGVDIKNSLLI